MHKKIIHVLSNFKLGIQSIFNFIYKYCTIKNIMRFEITLEKNTNLKKLDLKFLKFEFTPNNLCYVNIT